jgi:hypothetical protein
MACDIITLILAHEHAARIHEFVRKARPSSPIVAVSRVPYIERDDFLRIVIPL